MPPSLQKLFWRRVGKADFPIISLWSTNSLISESCVLLSCAHACTKSHLMWQDVERLLHHDKERCAHPHTCTHTHMACHHNGTDVALCYLHGFSLMWDCFHRLESRQQKQGTRHLYYHMRSDCKQLCPLWAAHNRTLCDGTIDTEKFNHFLWLELLTVSVAALSAVGQSTMESSVGEGLRL